MPLDQPADHNQWWELGNNYIKLYSHDDSIGCQQCWDNDVSGIAAKSKALIMYLILLQIFSFRWLTSTKPELPLWMNTLVADNGSNYKYEMFIARNQPCSPSLGWNCQCPTIIKTIHLPIRDSNKQLIIVNLCSWSISWLFGVFTKISLDSGYWCSHQLQSAMASLQYW